MKILSFGDKLAFLSQQVFHFHDLNELQNIVLIR